VFGKNAINALLAAAEWGAPLGMTDAIGKYEAIAYPDVGLTRDQKRCGSNTCHSE